MQKLKYWLMVLRYTVGGDGSRLSSVVQAAAGDDERTMQLLLKALSDRNSQVRLAAISGLCMRKHEAGETHAMAALTDSSEIVRRDAVRALLLVSHHRVVLPIVGAMIRNNRADFWETPEAWGLAKIGLPGTPETVRAIMPLLDQGATDKQKTWALSVLEAMNSEHAVIPLAAVFLETSQWGWSKLIYDRQEWAIKALRKMGETAVRVLVAEATGGSQLARRDAALKALEKLGIMATDQTLVRAREGVDRERRLTEQEEREAKAARSRLMEPVRIGVQMLLWKYVELCNDHIGAMHADPYNYHICVGKIDKSSQEAKKLWETYGLGSSISAIQRAAMACDNRPAAHNMGSDPVVQGIARVKPQILDALRSVETMYDRKELFTGDSLRFRNYIEEQKPQW